MKGRLTVVAAVAMAAASVGCADDDDSASAADDVFVPLPRLTLTADESASDGDLVDLFNRLGDVDDVEAVSRKSGKRVMTVRLDDIDDDIGTAVARLEKLDHVATVALLPVQELFLPFDDVNYSDRAALIKAVGAVKGVDRVEDRGGGLAVYLTSEDQALYETFPELAVIEGVEGISVVDADVEHSESAG